MASFDFITSEDFRRSLDRDSAEMAACYQAEAWKATQVLAGSIIEATLCDFLVATDYEHTHPGSTPVLKMVLSQLIDASTGVGLLSAGTVAVATVVREYRNLIHPGRLLRLGERVDRNTASIAMSLVELIASDVATRRAQIYGLTAEQLEKLEADSTSLPIFPRLLASAAATERERFVLTVLPARYIALAGKQPSSEPPLPILRSAHRAALDAADDSVKRKAAAEVVRVVTREAGFTVTTYETALFRGSDLAYMSEGDRRLVSEHVIAEVGKRTPELFPALEEIGEYLEDSQIVALVEVAVRWVIADPRRRTTGGAFLETLWMNTPPPNDVVVRDHLTRWLAHFQARSSRNPELDVWCQQLIDSMALLNLAEEESIDEAALGEQIALEEEARFQLRQDAFERDIVLGPADEPRG